MIGPDSIYADFVIKESLYADDTRHSLELRHDELETYARFEATKTAGDEPTSFTMFWQTALQARGALELIDNADRFTTLGAQAGLVAVHNTSITECTYYDWLVDGKMNDDDEAVGIEEILAGDVGHIDLRFDDSKSIGWNTLFRSPRRFMMGLETPNPLAEWVKELYAFTVDAKTNEVISRNIDSLTGALTTFMELPLGQPTFSGGFTQE